MIKILLVFYCFSQKPAIHNFCEEVHIKMTDTIIAAIIGFLGMILGTIIGALLNAFFLNKRNKNKNKGIYFLEPSQNFNDLLKSKKEICMYVYC